MKEITTILAAVTAMVLMLGAGTCTSNSKKWR